MSKEEEAWDEARRRLKPDHKPVGHSFSVDGTRGSVVSKQEVRSNLSNLL